MDPRTQLQGGYKEVVDMHAPLVKSMDMAHNKGLDYVVDAVEAEQAEGLRDST
jgi:hypothetical protein